MGKKFTTGYAYGNLSFPANRVDLRDKNTCVRYYVRKWLVELQSMLRFDGLPDTIPERELKRLLQINGFAVLPDPKMLPEGKPYAFYAGLGGEPDPYYMPTLAVVSNPALNLSATYELHKDAVLVRHDSYMAGLIPTLTHFATLTVDADLSLYLASILSRAPVHIKASGDRSKASADDYLKGLEDGNLGAIFEDGFLNGLMTAPGSSESNQTITNLIEYRQYLKASRWNEIGLNANYNMKREAINSAESQMNNDALTPFTDDIIKSIQTDLDEYNELFGYDIKVNLAGAWAVKEKEIDAKTEILEQQANEDDTTTTEENGGAEDVETTIDEPTA